MLFLGEEEVADFFAADFFEALLVREFAEGLDTTVLTASAEALSIN